MPRNPFRRKPSMIPPAYSAPLLDEADVRRARIAQNVDRLVAADNAQAEQTRDAIATAQARALAAAHFDGEFALIDAQGLGIAPADADPMDTFTWLPPARRIDEGLARYAASQHGREFAEDRPTYTPGRDRARVRQAARKAREQEARLAEANRYATLILDGQAFERGQAAASLTYDGGDGEAVALHESRVYLADRQDGARRAALVLAGYAGVTALELAGLDR